MSYNEALKEHRRAWAQFSQADGVHDPGAVDQAVYRILCAEKALDYFSRRGDKECINSKECVCSGI